MTSQLRWPVLVTALLAVALTGCAAPLPPPGPTPGFTSEAEAFAAAEKTYRAYVDALNEWRRDRSAPDPRAFLISEALEVDIETQQSLTRRGLRVTGSTTIVDIQSLGSSHDLSETSISVCLESSGTRVLDESDVDVTPVDRETRSSLVVTTRNAGKDTLITRSEAGLDGTC